MTLVKVDPELRSVRNRTKSRSILKFVHLDGEVDIEMESDTLDLLENKPMPELPNEHKMTLRWRTIIVGNAEEFA